MAEAEKERQSEESWSECKADAADRLRFYGPQESSLENGLGKYRIHLPYFQLDEGASLAFLRVHNGKGTGLPGGVHAATCEDVSDTGWRGIGVNGFAGQSERFQTVWGGASATIPAPGGFAITVDMHNGATPSVDRSSLRISREVFAEISSKIQADAEVLLEKFLEGNATSTFSALNRALALQWFPTKQIPLSEPIRSLILPIGERSNTFVWGHLSYPFIELLAGSLAFKGTVQSVVIDGKPIDYYRVVSTSGGYNAFISTLSRVPGKRLVILSEQDLFYLPAPLWDGPPTFSQKCVGFETHFPSDWKSVCAVMLRNAPLWNIAHPVVRSITPDAWHWASRNIHSGDPRQHLNEILQQRDKAAAWLLMCIMLRKGENFWKAVYEQAPEIIRVLEPFFSDDERSIRVWDFGGRYSHSSDTLEITATDAVVTENLHETRKGLFFGRTKSTLPWPTETHWRGTVTVNRR